MTTEKTCWVLAYGYSPTEPKGGHAIQFDSYEEADAYATKLNHSRELIFSPTFCIRTVREYCRAYNLDFTMLKNTTPWK